MAERETWAGPRADAGNGEEEAGARLRAVATRLFAELGYDAVSTQMIADAAGVAPGTVADLHGGKPGLYRAAMEEASRRWLDHLESVHESVPPGTDGLIQMMDLYLDYSLAHPELPKLWIYRWMSDASDITGLEERLSAPLVREGIDSVRSAISPAVDPEAALWTLIWTIHGYLQAGYLDASGRRRPPGDPETLHRFRVHVHQLIRLMAAPN